MKILAGVLAAIFAVAVVASMASASEVGLQVLERATNNDYGTQTNPIEMCSGPLTAREVLVRVSNIGPSTDTYSMSLQDLPAGWTGQIQTDVMLASGEAKNLDLFVLNTYYTAPGTYFFTIKAQSGTDQGTTASKRLQVDILPCYSLAMTPVDSTRQSACGEKSDEANYTISIKNTGKYKDTIDLSIPSPARLSTPSVTLEPDKETIFTATIPSKGLQGDQQFPVVARSRLTQTTANVTLTLSVNDCFSSDVSIDPAEQTGCVSKPAQFKLTVKNTGNGDAYVVSVPLWAAASETSFSLDRGNSKDITITANPTTQGKMNLDVVVKSSDVPSEKKVKASLDVSECRDLVVLASPATSTVCQGQMTSYDVTVKNRGVLEDTVTVTATNGSLSLNKLTLPAGQSQTLQLNVDTSAMAVGKNTIEVSAGDGKVSDKSVVDVNVENCYSSEVEITPENKTVCPQTGFNYTIKLTNTGKQDDTYEVTFRDILETATLASGQSASWDIPVFADESGAYTLTANARSNNSESGATAVLVVQPMGKCYAVEIKADKTARTKVNEASTVKLTIKNTGTVADGYQITVEGPSWAYVVPNNTTLEHGVSGDVYLYMSPPLDADNSSVKVTVKATSGNAVGSAEVKVLVGNAQDEGGFSTGGIKGAVLFDLGDRPFWKVAAIAIIALAIIVILVVRFVVLVK